MKEGGKGGDLTAKIAQVSNLVVAKKGEQVKAGDVRWEILPVEGRRKR